MSNSRRISIFVVFAVAVLLAGFATARYFNTTEAQTAKTEVAWKHNERPLKTVDSKFKVNLPNFSQDTDWIAAVKPIKEGEKEKMYVGVFTWEDVENESAKNQGFKRLSRMEDYSQESASFADGESTLAASINSNQTLVIYMEVAPSTQTIFNENGKETSLNTSEGSFLIFDGKIEKMPIENISTLMAQANVKKLRKEISKHSLIKNEDK